MTSVVQSGMLTISDSPQYFDRPTTAKLITSVIACLVPAAAWGVYAYGLWALSVLAVAMGSTLGSEFLLSRLRKRPMPRDGHTILVGLLIGMVMPPAVPLWLPAAAGVFAIVAVKWPLGGIGASWMHPAAAGWAFALICWPQLMNNYAVPSFFTGPLLKVSPSPDAYSAIAGWFTQNQPNGLGPSDILSNLGFYRSAYDGSITDFLNRFALAPFAANLPGGYVDALLGTGIGAIGEVSSVLLLAGSVALIARGLVSWHVPVSFFGIFAVLTYVFGALPFGGGLGGGDILFMALHGSFLLVLFFVATDISTGPLTYRGRILYGLGLGLVTFLIQFAGRGGDAALVAVLCMNMVTGSIDQVCRTRRPGQRS